MSFSFWRRKKSNAELNEEIQSHLMMAARNGVERGESSEGAADAARREMGNAGLIQEVTRDMWGWRWVSNFAQDLRYGMRMMARSKRFTAVAVISLAVGIGASTAIFSVAREVLFKMLPVRSPEQLVLLRWSSGPKLMGFNFSPGFSVDPLTGESTGKSFSYLSFKQFQSQSKTLSGVVGFTRLFEAGDGPDQTDKLFVQFVSGNYFTSLGVPAAMGRTILESDDNEAADLVAVISDRYWEQKYGRDPSVIGKAIRVGNASFNIIGVTPPGFSGTQGVGSSPDVSIAIGMTARLGPGGPKFIYKMLKSPEVWATMIMGRLKPGESLDSVRAELESTFQATALEGWNASPRKSSNQKPDTPRLAVVPGGQGLTEARHSLSSTVLLMMIIVSVVLLVMCANLASLLLARAVARRKEIAVRLAIGASRGRLVAQMLTESLLLAVSGAILGGIFSIWGKGFFLAWISRVDSSFVIEPRIDLRVLGFTAAVTILTGVFVGLAPALRATRIDLNAAMQGKGRATGRPSSLATRSLVVVQVALSIVLLVGAGLFIRTLLNLEKADVGFDTHNLLLFDAQPRGLGQNRQQFVNLYARMIERVEAVAGVRAATNSAYPLLAGDFAMPFLYVPGHNRRPDEDPTVYNQQIWPNFFKTMEMPVLLGRELSSQDGPNRGVVNETLARRYFQGANPIGQRIGITKDPSLPPVPESDLIQIVGVVRDAKYTTVRQEVPPTVFRTFISGGVTFEVRTIDNPTKMSGSIREAIRQVDPSVIISGFRTQSEQAQQTFARERHFAFLTSLFGLVALLLVCIGLYGLLSFNVANRTREMGIRVALGAQKWQVIRLVMNEAFLLLVMGTIVGIAAAYGTTRVVANMLYGLAPNDIGTILLAILTMSVVAGIAAFLPSRRASRVDPMVALRHE